MPLTSYKSFIPTTWSKETYSIFLENLVTLQDKKYKESSKKLNSTEYEIIGIKLPILNSISKEISNTNIYNYLDNIKPKYFEEILLEGLVLSYINDYEKFTKYYKEFLNQISNLSIYDLPKYRVIETNKDEYLNIVKDLINSNNPNYIRIGIKSLIDYYINDKNYLEYFFETIELINTNNEQLTDILSLFITKLFINYRTRTLEYLESNNLSDYIKNKVIIEIRKSPIINRLDKKIILKYKKSNK